MLCNRGRLLALLFLISAPFGVGRHSDVLSAGPFSRVIQTRGWVGPTVGFDALRRDKFLVGIETGLIGCSTCTSGPVNIYDSD